MVGETRDREVAEITVQAALTGHLVFSTLHAGDGAATARRLVEMGVRTIFDRGMPARYHFAAAGTLHLPALQATGGLAGGD